MLFSKILKTDHSDLFGDTIGYDHIKRLFRIALLDINANGFNKALHGRLLK